MKRNRIIYLVLLAISLAGISFYGGPVSYGFFALCVLVPLMSLAYTVLLFWRFKIYQYLDSNSVMAGRNTDFYFTLQNEDLFAFAGISVDFFSTFSTISGLETGTEYELMPHSGIQRQTGIVCKYRGEYEIGVKQVVVQDYFRLFRLTFRNRETLKVTVKPRMVFPEALKHADDLLVSSKDAYMNRTEPDVLVREYAPGDDIRYINWKVTARRQKLSVRNRIGEEKSGVYIIMDSRRYSEEQADYLPVENKILETTLALSWYYLNKGLKTVVGNLQGGLREHTLSYMADYDGFYQILSNFVFSTEQKGEILTASLQNSAGLFSSRFVLYVVHEWDEAYMQHAAQLILYGIPVMAYIVKDGDLVSLRQVSGGEMDFVQIPTDADLLEVL